MPSELPCLRRVVVADEVSRTLFQEFAEHRASSRGREEIGWLLLGVRYADVAVVLATLPAGMQRSASAVHVRFHTASQALASRIVRQEHKQLTLLGVVHTHPGSLRHPSDGDLRGDAVWVAQLRGRQGIFAIGTADAPKCPLGQVAWQPQVHEQCWQDLRFSWYALKAGASRYEALPVTLTLGPDFALPLRPVWPVLEHNARRLDDLAQQLHKVQLAIVEGKKQPALALRLPLANGADELYVQLEGSEVRYLLLRAGQALAADLNEPRVDRGVYLMLAELASQTE